MYYKSTHRDCWDPALIHMFYAHSPAARISSSRIRSSAADDFMSFEASNRRQKCTEKGEGGGAEAAQQQS